MPPFPTPLFVGFDMLDEVLHRHTGSKGGYPPYNIEVVSPVGTESGILRVTLAVAGFDEDELEVRLEENHLIIRGQQQERGEVEYLYRGIAARKFERVFRLAKGIEVEGAHLRNGLLMINLRRPEIEVMVKKINIYVGN